MSSAILYVAIVAIWIGVLVPRWLRHDHAHHGHLRLRRFSRHFGAGGQASQADPRAGFSQGGRPRYTSFGGPGNAPAGRTGFDGASRHTRPSEDDALPHSYNGAYVSAPVGGNTDDMAQLYETDTESSPVRRYGWSAQEYLRQERVSQRDPRPERPHRDERSHRDEPLPHGERPHHDGHGHHDERPQRPHSGEPAGPRSAERPGTADRERRARRVRGRRRMLWMFIVLTVIAVGLAYLQLAGWWIVMPPTILLFGYLLLLREAAHADAEAWERHAAERAAALARSAREAEAQRAADAQRAAETRRAAQAGQVPGGSAPVWPAHEPLPHAEIIDISERVGDQLYDQYADAKLRAVGD